MRRLALHRVAALVFLVAAFCFSPARAHGPIQGDVAELSRRIEAGVDVVDHLLRRAELHRLARDFELAAADLDRAVSLAPSRPEVALARAALHFDTGRADHALITLDTFLANAGEHAVALTLRARILESLGRPADAARELSRAIAATARPTPELYVERARLLEACGPERRAEALAQIERGIVRLGPIVSLTSRAIDLELALGRPDAALERLERLAPQFERRAPLLDRRAEILTAAGRLEEAALARAAAAADRGREGAAFGNLERAAPAPVAVRDGATPAETAADMLVPRNSAWRYHAQGIDLGTSWREPGYDDGAWPGGPGILGFGETYIATTVPFGPDPLNKYTTTYFRAASFDLPVDSAEVRVLTLAVNYDDGFVAYLNGQQILSRSIPPGSVGYGTFALSHEGGVYEATNVPGAVPYLRSFGNVLAFEVHQTDPGSSDLVFDAELTYSAGPAFVTRGPYLQVGTSSGVVMRWRTDVPTDSRVRYGASPGALTSNVDDPVLTTEHEISIAGLAPNTRTFYSVGTTTFTLVGGDSSFSFTTAPAPTTPAPTRLWVLGDSGTPGTEAQRVRDAYLGFAVTRPANLWLMLGDNAYNAGTDAEYQAAVFDQYPGILRNTVLWPTRGNHDLVYAGPLNDYYDIFTMPTAGQAGGLASGSEAYYSFDWSNLHVICLDSEGTNRAPGSPMLTWLANDLAATTQPWIVAFWHHPPYTKGSHDSDDAIDSGGRMRDMRQNALPILEAGGADLVLCGHSHCYERSFLLDGHYGVSSTLTPAMKIDPGDGRMSGDGAYAKSPTTPAPHLGTVYAVDGSGSMASGGPLNHPAMFTSMNRRGSMVIDVDGFRLDARFIDSVGVVRDSFTIVKGGALTAPGSSASGLSLAVVGPNPTSGGTRFAGSLPAAGAMRLELLDATGRRVKTLARGRRAAGPFEIAWDGRDAGGRRAAAGVYFAVLEHGDRRVARKLVRLP